MTGRRRKVEVRREELLTATLEQVERLGLAATRVADVAQALGVSPALVFYHFGTKDALLAEAFAYAVQRDLDRLDAAVARGTDPVDRLRRAMKEYGPTGSAPGWRLWIDAWAVALRDPGIRTVLRTLDRRWKTVLRQLIEEGVAAGSFRCDDPRGTVTRVVGLADGLAVGNVVHGKGSRAELRRWVGDALADELDLDRELLR
ncbi:TetR/AcrR family transcriptional regulator [Nocardioides caldifontis]|uniref:TetR/AcrR family transcriptional regulator n=1 Tax=Nocardioides caldifontis TaxID=2588938 RepID=UPI0019393CB8|nr:TetR/AcrR family transcriptional regulator [Nocardioides caldifontis]